MITRKPDWLNLLFAFIASRKNAGYAWGVNDCCMFAADAVLATTGHDYASEFRGRYQSKIGAARALKRYGHDDINSTLTALLGEPVSPLNLRRGDVVFADIKGRLTVGILLNTPLAPGDTQLENFDVSYVLHGWRIG